MDLSETVAEQLGFILPQLRGDAELRELVSSRTFQAKVALIVTEKMALSLKDGGLHSFAWTSGPFVILIVTYPKPPQALAEYYHLTWGEFRWYVMSQLAAFSTKPLREAGCSRALIMHFCFDQQRRLTTVHLTSTALEPRSVSATPVLAPEMLSALEARRVRGPDESESFQIALTPQSPDGRGLPTRLVSVLHDEAEFVPALQQSKALVVSTRVVSQLLSTGGQLLAQFARSQQLFIAGVDPYAVKAQQVHLRYQSLDVGDERCFVTDRALSFIAHLLFRHQNDVILLLSSDADFIRILRNDWIGQQCGQRAVAEP
jgi:hypothetical protein